MQTWCFCFSLAWGLIYVAEFVSAAKRALSRMLIIVVCEGFGTVKYIYPSFDVSSSPSVHSFLLLPLVPPFLPLFFGFPFAIFLLILFSSLPPRPRLGPTLAKVVAVGLLYFVMAFIDGIVRSTKVGPVSIGSYYLPNVCTCMFMLIFVV